MFINVIQTPRLDKEAADKLSKTVDEACLLLAEYNGRLAAELEDRRQLARMLTEYIGSQKDALTEREKKLEARHRTRMQTHAQLCLCQRYFTYTENISNIFY